MYRLQATNHAVFIIELYTIITQWPQNKIKSNSTETAGSEDSFNRDFNTRSYTKSLIHVLYGKQETSVAK
jgi:hypothetical protein